VERYIILWFMEVILYGKNNKEEYYERQY
jgi:hypothetical protein